MIKYICIVIIFIFTNLSGQSFKCKVIDGYTKKPVKDIMVAVSGNHLRHLTTNCDTTDSSGVVVLKDIPNTKCILVLDHIKDKYIYQHNLITIDSTSESRDLVYSMTRYFKDLKNPKYKKLTSRICNELKFTFTLNYGDIDDAVIARITVKNLTLDTLIFPYLTLQSMVGDCSFGKCIIIYDSVGNSLPITHAQHLGSNYDGSIILPSNSSYTFKFNLLGESQHDGFYNKGKYKIKFCCNTNSGFYTKWDFEQSKRGYGKTILNKKGEVIKQIHPDSPKIKSPGFKWKGKVVLSHDFER